MPYKHSKVMLTGSSKETTDSSDEEVQEMNETSEFVHLLEPSSSSSIHEENAQPNSEQNTVKQDVAHEIDQCVEEKHFMTKEDWETELAQRHLLGKWRLLNAKNNNEELPTSHVEHNNYTKRSNLEEEWNEQQEELHLKECEEEEEQEEKQHDNATDKLKIFAIADNTSELQKSKLVAQWECTDKVSSSESYANKMINYDEYDDDTDNQSNDVFFEPSSLIFAHLNSNDSESILNENINNEEERENKNKNNSNVKIENNVKPEVIDVESEDVFARFNEEDDEQSNTHLTNNVVVPEMVMNNNINNENENHEEVIIDVNHHHHQPTRKRLRLNLSIDTSFAIHANNDLNNLNSANTVFEKKEEEEEEQQQQQKEVNSKLDNDMSTQQEHLKYHPTRRLRLHVPQIHHTDMNYKNTQEINQEQEIQNEQEETKMIAEECNSNDNNMESNTDKTETLDKCCELSEEEEKQEIVMTKPVQHEKCSNNTHTELVEQETTTTKIENCKNSDNNKSKNNEEHKLHSSFNKASLPYMNINASKYRRPYSPNSPFPSPSPMLINSASSTPSINTKLHSKLRLKLPCAPIVIDFSTVQHHCVEEYYEKGEQIGSGTYGEVFIGKERATNAPVAMKWLKTLKGLEGFPITSLREVIALKHIEKQRARVRMEQEERLEEEDVTTALNSQKKRNTSENNVMNNSNVKVCDPLEEMISLRDVLLSGNESHDIVLVFNYAGHSIAQLLYKNFRFYENEVRYIFRKLVSGVAKLHEMGIIHRDIKADNVLLSGNGAVQLADFGLCVFMNSNRDLTPSIINLSYRPPEMLLGSQRYDEKIDIWSIGCLLAHFYLHKPPFFAIQHHRDNNNNDNGANNTKESLAEQHRNTELQQLAQICYILGPLSTVSKDAFNKANRQYLSNLQFLLQQYKQRTYKTCNNSSTRTNTVTSIYNSSYSDKMISTSHNLDPLFEESQCYCTCKGFRQWFVNAMRRRQKYCANYKILMPSDECVDVLCAIFQLDSRKRPTANELLQMPFFTNFIQEPTNQWPNKALFYQQQLYGNNYKNSFNNTNVKTNEAICESSVRSKLAEKLAAFKKEHIRTGTESV